MTRQLAAPMPASRDEAESRGREVRQRRARDREDRERRARVEALEHALIATALVGSRAELRDLARRAVDAALAAHGRLDMLPSRASVRAIAMAWFGPSIDREIDRVIAEHR